MPRSRIFVDTSAWYAIIDKKDQDHTAAVNKIQLLGRPLVTSNDILPQYADKGFSFTDCTSFALMERLDINTVFAFDDHFAQYGKFMIL
jgi:predicted nucleic acid-binding protein